MIIKNHADMSRVLKNICSISISEPVEFIECRSGEDAIGKYELHHPDCVLMDVQLKSMNGFETTEKICSENKEAKIIIVTSYDSPFFRKKTKDLHTKGFVCKGRLSDLHQLLQNITS